VGRALAPRLVTSRCALTRPSCIGKAIHAGADGPEFAYTSLESETEHLISFTPGHGGYWIASSADGLTSHPVALGELRAASLDFVSRIYWLAKPLVDVREWLSDIERLTLDRILTEI
jgi:hypothetical protein